MSTITTKDGSQRFYKDWGTGQPVVFSHGWILSSDTRADAAADIEHFDGKTTA